MKQRNVKENTLRLTTLDYVYNDVTLTWIQCIVFKKHRLKRV